MVDRTLVYYEDGGFNSLRIERSAAGQPRLLLVAVYDDGETTREEVVVSIDDGNALLAPVLEWLNRG